MGFAFKFIVEIYKSQESFVVNQPLFKLILNI